MRRSRAEEISPVERPRDRFQRVCRVRQLVRLGDAGARRGRQQEPVVGPDVHAPLPVAKSERTPWASYTGIDDREVDPDGHEPDRVRQHEGALEDRRRRDPVGDVDDLHVRGDALDHAVARADEIVLEPEVAEEGDEHGAERSAGLRRELPAASRPAAQRRGIRVSSHRTASRRAAGSERTPRAPATEAAC